MLNQQTIEKLHALGLIGMAEAFNEQLQQPDMDRLSFEAMTDGNFLLAGVLSMVYGMS